MSNPTKHEMTPEDRATKGTIYAFIVAALADHGMHATDSFKSELAAAIFNFTRLRTPQGEPALTQSCELPGTREPVVTAPQGNAGESPAPIPVASPGAIVSGEDSAALTSESSRPRGLLTSNLRLNGVSRAADDGEPFSQRVVELHFNRRPTDDELRALHVYMRYFSDDSSAPETKSHVYQSRSSKDDSCVVCGESGMACQGSGKWSPKTTSQPMQLYDVIEREIGSLPAERVIAAICAAGLRVESPEETTENRESRLPAGEQEANRPASQKATAQPPVDNDHVAPGCEKFHE